MTKLPSVEERNAAFERMSPPERRVAIAKDILAQLANTEIIARRGVYVCGVYEEADLHNPQYCTVCAVGAAVVSAARLFDRVPSDYSFNTLSSSGFRSLWLTEFFSQAQLALIECAFEKTSDFSHDFITYEEAARAADWGLQFDSDGMCLRHIYQNIIRNKGEFILPKRFRPKAAS